MDRVRGNVYFFILMKLKDLHHKSHAMLIKWLQVAEMITLDFTKWHSGEVTLWTSDIVWKKVWAILIEWNGTLQFSICNHSYKNKTHQTKSVGYDPVDPYDFTNHWWTLDGGDFPGAHDLLIFVHYFGIIYQIIVLGLASWIHPCFSDWRQILTRMHSSRMRTVRSSSRLLGGGIVCTWGVCSGGCQLLGWGRGGIPACTEADTPLLFRNTGVKT